MADQNESFLVPLAPPVKKNNIVNDKIKKESPEYMEPDWGGFRSLATPFKFEVLKSGTIIEEQLVFDNYKEQSFILVGRLPTCDLSLNHESVSRNHAVLQQRASDGALFVYDLGSTHGTFVNKTKVKPKQYFPLKEGDFLKFGNSSRQFILSGGPQSSESTNNLSTKIQPQNVNTNEDTNLSNIKSATQHTKADTFNESDEVDKAEEEENADLEHVRDNYLDYYLGNAEEDFDDDFYDRTKKGKSKPNEIKSVETASSLQSKKRDLEQQVSSLENQLKGFEDSQATTDNSDELDAFMNNLNASVKLEEKKRIEQQLQTANEEYSKVIKLLQLVSGGVPEPLEPTKKSKERTPEKPQPISKKPKIVKPPLPIFQEAPKSNKATQDFVPEYDDDYSEVPMQFYRNQ